MNKIKIISILAVLVAVSVNAADPFSTLPSGGFASPVFTAPKISTFTPVYTTPIVYKPVAVSAYTTTAGTYVAPHIRSAPNGTQADNYSAKGIINPWTGVAGTVRPTK